VLEVLRQRRWLGFSAFVLAMLALCVVLANWQWNRYQQRNTENDLLDAALAAPTTSISQLLEADPADAVEAFPDELEWRSATATGQFDAAAEVAVRRRPLDGRTGFWIVTPLVTDRGVLLVNRGWAPAGQDATARPEVQAPPVGTVTVTGRLRAPESTSQTEPAPVGQAWAADPVVLVTPESQARYNAYLVLGESDPPATEGLTELPEPGHRGLNNLVYSVQWLIFAAVGVVGWWRLIRQESRRDPHDDAHPDATDATDANWDADWDGGSDDGSDDGSEADPGTPVEVRPDTRPAG
jgi:cytochrome oxidase assembly protein ShyY1